MLIEGASLDYYFNEVLKQGFNIQHYTSVGFKYSSHLEKLFDKLEGVVFYDYQEQDLKNFSTKYISKYNKRAVIGAARSYDSVYVLKEAIENCGFDQKKLPDCLAQTDYLGTVGQIKFDEKHQQAKSTGLVQVIELQNSKFVTLK